MLGYRRILDEKFRSGTEAIDYAKAAGWTYVGQSGLIKKLHTYRGCTVQFSSPSSDARREVHDLRLQLSDNGVAALFIASKIGVLATTRLPESVWPSEDVYDHIQRVVGSINEEALPKGLGLQVWGSSDYRVVGLADNAARQTFRDPTQAQKWIRGQGPSR